MEQKYYNIKPLLKKGCQYNLLIGERSNGKSYQAKIVILYEAWTGLDYLTNTPKERHEFGYIRRWREEIKQRDVERYFSDMHDYIVKITRGEADAIVCYRNDLFFAFTSDDGKTTRIKKAGSCFALTGATHYKSLAFPHTGNIIFEEFLTKYGYLPRECDTLMDIVSTIARRESIRVLLVGNTIDRMCPYFREWQLNHVKNQKQGTIDIYHQGTSQTDDRGLPIVISIAVEYCENSGNNSKMFFGQSSKMITGGEWEASEQPHLVGSLKDYECYYKVQYDYLDFSFIINLLVTKEGHPFLYVYPNTREERSDIIRRISDNFSTNRFTTNYLTPLLKYDRLILELITEHKVVFSDNLTGTEFYEIKTQKGRF